MASAGFNFNFGTGGSGGSGSSSGSGSSGGDGGLQVKAYRSPATSHIPTRTTTGGISAARAYTGTHQSVQRTSQTAAKGLGHIPNAKGIFRGTVPKASGGDQGQGDQGYSDDGTYYEDQGQYDQNYQGQAQDQQDQQDQGQDQSDEPSYMMSASRAAEMAQVDVNPVTKENIFLRIWHWITGKKPVTSGEVASMHGDMTVEEAAETLVERARLGDQNAMGMIAAIQHNAGSNDKARRASLAIARYIKNNPVVMSMKALPHDQQALANARALEWARSTPLTDDKVRELWASFGSEADRNDFERGFNHHENGKIYPADSEASNLGRMVGYARGLQIICLPRATVSDYSSIVGWELGE